MTEALFPLLGSKPNGRQIIWEKENYFTILTWQGYIKETGNYWGYRSTWFVNHELKEIRLIEYEVRRITGEWINGAKMYDPTPPDLHKRLARQIGRITFDVKQFRRLKL